MTKSGIINVNKGKNMTSHDVVAIVRRVLGIKRVGHTGTLDPMAEGVLPVAVGNATKFIEYLDKDTKTYLAGVKLGLMTDTLDVWGDKIETSDKSVSTEELRSKVCEIIPVFIGEIQQIPPKYSAIKVDGRRLYDYARKGMDVEIPSRKVNIYRLKYISPTDTKYLDSLIGFVSAGDYREKSDFFLLIECSRGTYVRSLIRDIGERLGVSAVMSFLVRTVSGDFRIEDGVSAESIKNMSMEDLTEYILPIDEKISCMGSIVIDQVEGKKFQNGGKVSLKKIAYLDKDNSERLFKVYEISSCSNGGGSIYNTSGSEEGNATSIIENKKFLGIGRIVDDRFLKGEKVVPIESV